MAEDLNVFIEREGIRVHAGMISGSGEMDACFQYCREYLSDPLARPLSVSLPLQEEIFDSECTRSFFDGLLPEGYTRRCVAAEMRVASDDYISILKNLGKECLGAIQILDQREDFPEAQYEKMTEERLRLFAREGAVESAALVTKAHLSLTGASGKAGLYYQEETGDWYLPVGTAPSTHIVKQSHVRLNQIVANEQLCLFTAKHLGIEVPDSFILRFEDSDDGNVLFATRRFDRQMRESHDFLTHPYRLHQEDFAQALGIPAEKKYEKNREHYLRQMMDLIQKYSENPLRDQMNLWRIVVFDYLVGNTDNHVKNYSLLYSPDLSGIRLAPAYDIVSTVIYENSSEEMALSINGKYDIYQITREDFLEEAKQLGVGTKIYMREFDRLRNEFPEALRISAAALADAGIEQSWEIAKKILGRMNGML